MSIVTVPYVNTGFDSKIPIVNVAYSYPLRGMSLETTTSFEVKVSAENVSYVVSPTSSVLEQELSEQNSHKISLTRDAEGALTMEVISTAYSN
jgi:hypothetical protein